MATKEELEAAVAGLETKIDDVGTKLTDFAGDFHAAIDALKQSGNLSWLILGDMGEVGNQGPEFHREVGAYAAEQGISKLFALGEQCEFALQGFNKVTDASAAKSSAIHFSDMDSLIAQLRDALHAQSSGSNQHLNILVKGSRFMRMERVVQALLEEAKTCS